MIAASGARGMNNWNIAIVVSPGTGSWARKIRRLLDASWNSQPQADFRIIKLNRLTPSIMEELDGVVLLASSRAKQPTLVRPLTELDESHVPVLALLNGAPEPGGVFEHASVLIEDRNTNGSVLCARLHDMMHRQREVNRLRREVAMSRVWHGGLGDEVARMHDELQLAASAQRELLPQDLPHLHEVSVATLWRPAQYVSGDIYDVTQLDDDHIGLFLADAVGHGVSAALMTMVITQSLTTRVHERSGWRILDPAEVLTRLNDQLIGRRIHPSRFATAVYAVVDCRERRMAIASAGHPPALLVRTDGRSETLATSGGLLGVFENEEYEQIELPLGLGERLLLYSDGFEQAFPDPAASGDRPPKRSNLYREEFRKLADAKDPQEMIETISRRLDLQSGSLHQPDDLTLLCLQAGVPADRQKAA